MDEIKPIPPLDDLQMVVYERLRAFNLEVERMFRLSDRVYGRTLSDKFTAHGILEDITE